MNHRRYHLGVGPGLLPRIGHGAPITLAEALDRAAGHPYAVIYRLAENGKAVPVIAGAGGQEIIHVPTGCRLRRHDIGRRQRLTEQDLAATNAINDPRIAAPLVGDNGWFTSWRHARYLATGTSPPAAPTLGQRLADALGWDQVPQLTADERQEIDRKLDEAQARARRA